jgi:outer membrane protein TolC
MMLGLVAFLGSGPVAGRAQSAPPMAEGPPRPAAEGLPPALPDEPPGEDRNVRLPPLPASAPGRPVRLADVLAMSLRNVETVQANLTVRVATVARFEALKAFVPLVNLPQLQVGFRRLNGDATDGRTVIFPDITGGTPLAGQPSLDYAELNRFNIFLPLDPSGHITALPIAEEGIRAKELMEQLVRRSQAILAAQRYFDAKQLEYALRTARAGTFVAGEGLARVERELRERQAHDVEVTQAKVDLGRSRVFLTEFEKDARVAQRRLGVVVHQCRLLVPQELGPVPVDPETAFTFDLGCPDTIDLGLVPDFPRTREEAVQLAKRQRLEVRLLEIGLRIARLSVLRDKTRLLGMGQLPLGMSLKNTSTLNGGAALGMIFGSLYELPVVQVDLWARVRGAKLDIIRSQLDLEKSLLDAAEDAGTSWDAWQQAGLEWEQKESEYRLRIEYRERIERLFREQQAIRLEVWTADVGVLQADANRWTAWYNLQLARLNVLRASELLLDYIEKAGVADLPGTDLAAPRPAPRRGFFDRLAHARRAQPLAGSEP